LGPESRRSHERGTVDFVWKSLVYDPFFCERPPVSCTGRTLLRDTPLCGSVEVFQEVPPHLRRTLLRDTPLCGSVEVFQEVPPSPPFLVVCCIVLNIYILLVTDLTTIHFHRMWMIPGGYLPFSHPHFHKGVCPIKVFLQKLRQMHLHKTLLRRYR